MNLFNKEVNEQIAIDYLKKFDDRYKNLVKSECPDFISIEDSIGVEVRVVDFGEFLGWDRYIGKSLYDYAEIINIKPEKKLDFDYENNAILNGDLSSFQYMCDNYYYCFRKEKVMRSINSLEEYNNLDNNTNLYYKDYFPDAYYLDGKIIKLPIGFSFFPELIVDKYIEAVKEKNQKFSNYRNFNENSLLLVNFTTEKDEILEFEKRIREIDGINFDKIFVLNAMFNKNIHEIDLRK